MKTLGFSVVFTLCFTLANGQDSAKNVYAPKNENESRIKRHHLGFYIAPGIGINVGIHSAQIPDYAPVPDLQISTVTNYSTISEQPGGSYRLGVQYESKEFFNSFYFSTSIEFASVLYSGMASSIVNTYEEGVYPNYGFHLIGSSAGSNISYSITTSMIEIPIEFNKIILVKNKHRLGIGVGFLPGIYLEQSLSSPDIPTNSYGAGRGINEGYNAYSGFSKWGSLSLIYEKLIGTKTLFKIEPYFMLDLTKGSDESRVASVGIEFGFLHF